MDIFFVWCAIYFNLAAEDPIHIGGCLRYGDNVEDEWIALSLLYDLTRSYPNTIARVWDCDGEVGFACTNAPQLVLTFIFAWPTCRYC